MKGRALPLVALCSSTAFLAVGIADAAPVYYRPWCARISYERCDDDGCRLVTEYFGPAYCRVTPRIRGRLEGFYSSGAFGSEAEGLRPSQAPAPRETFVDD